jgi:hypothetical protein
MTPMMPLRLVERLLAPALNSNSTRSAMLLIFARVSLLMRGLSLRARETVE